MFTFLAASIAPCTGRDTKFIFSKNGWIMIVQDGGSSVLCVLRIKFASWYVCFWLRTWNEASDYSHIPTCMDNSHVRLSRWSPLSVWLLCLCCISIYQQLAFAFVDLSLHLFFTHSCSSEVQHNNRFRTTASI